MAKISIIVPVFNVEKMLPHCLDSIKAQTFSDFECLLIDDGSTDSSGILCDEYVAFDPRFKVIHSENQGAFQLPQYEGHCHRRLGQGDL